MDSRAPGRNVKGELVPTILPTQAEGSRKAGGDCLNMDKTVLSGSCLALKTAVGGNLTTWEDFQAEQIGSGFFSDVYKLTRRGSQRDPNHSVMVTKVSKSKDRTDQHKLVKELELMNKLCHKNVVKFLGACIREGQLHPVMEYINGGSLQSLLLNTEEPLGWQDKVSFGRDIADGMAYLHSQNVCHRDLTSQNILIREVNDKREAIVADLGLARQLLKNSAISPDDDLDTLRKMSLVGSAYWMAPEMLRGEEYNFKVDVFSYGIILCEIIARICADPDELPRTKEFGLDIQELKRKYPECSGGPEILFRLSTDCCQMVAMQRPTFLSILDTITRLYLYLKYGQACGIDKIQENPEENINGKHVPSPVIDANSSEEDKAWEEESLNKKRAGSSKQVKQSTCFETISEDTREETKLPHPWKKIL